LPPAPSDSQRLPEPPPQDDPGLVEAEPPLESAPTARISLVSKPPSLLSEQRSLPALPRRTTPLPGLKALFQNQPADAPPVPEMPAVITQPLPEPSAPRAENPAIRFEAPPLRGEKPEAPAFEPADDLPKPIDPLAAGDDDLAGIWQKMALLNEELAQTIQERDHALGDINQLRDQLRQSDELLAKGNRAASGDDVAQIARERDEALAELKALKEKSKSESQKIALPDGVTKTKEIVFLTQERDQARKEYSELRKQFEGLKRENPVNVTGAMPPPLPRDDSAKVRKELEQQLDGFRRKLEEKNKEIADLKAAAAAVAALPPPLPVPAPAANTANEDKLKAEIAELKAQLAKAKEDASIASRGLALSQKALQETRDTLREATEGTSLSRHNFENLKRELAAAKAQRQSGRVGM
jgi:hypothetical protein